MFGALHYTLLRVLPVNSDFISGAYLTNGVKPPPEKCFVVSRTRVHFNNQQLIS